METRDKRKINPDQSIAVPNDLVDRYIRLFNEKQLRAVFDLIGQAYRAGLHIGRNETQTDRK